MIRIVFAAAETRSFARESLVLEKVDGVKVSAATILCVIGEVGRELVERRDADAKSAEALVVRPENIPALSVVECDVRRFRMREPGCRRGGICRATDGGKRRTSA